jgi:hypothetical protein
VPEIEHAFEPSLKHLKWIVKEAENAKIKASLSRRDLEPMFDPVKSIEASVTNYQRTHMYDSTPQLSTERQQPLSAVDRTDADLCGRQTASGRKQLVSGMEVLGRIFDGLDSIDRGYAVLNHGKRFRLGEKQLDMFREYIQAMLTHIVPPSELLACQKYIQDRYNIYSSTTRYLAIFCERRVGKTVAAAVVDAVLLAFMQRTFNSLAINITQNLASERMGKIEGFLNCLKNDPDESKRANISWYIRDRNHLFVTSHYGNENYIYVTPGIDKAGNIRTFPFLSFRAKTQLPFSAAGSFDLFSNFFASSLFLIQALARSPLSFPMFF